MGESDRSRTIVDARSTIDASFHGVRYQVADVLRAAAFYTQRLGFTLERQQPARLRERVARPVARAAERSRRIRRPMPDGRRQEPGGWNRIVLGDGDLPACIDVLTSAGIRVRNQMEVGPGGRQVQIEDPDGNPIELFEPAK